MKIPLKYRVRMAFIRLFADIKARKKTPKIIFKVLGSHLKYWLYDSPFQKNTFDPPPIETWEVVRGFERKLK